MRSTKMSTRKTRTNRQGFTLVELLVVIAIIGVLVGLTVPAVLSVQGAFARAANKFEIQGLQDAVEKYRTKYGDYPPDGSSAAVTERHLRKAFPNILAAEIAAVTSQSMDPAEALVFYLGGFSADGQRPITGKGGPLVNTGTVATPVWQYNPERLGGFYDFPANRLAINDESELTGGTDDALPVFLARGCRMVVGEAAPYVYFDSRTYIANRGTTAVPILNMYQAASMSANLPFDVQSKIGAVRPFLASVNSAGAFTFENPKTFQIIGPGSDKLFGGRLQAVGAQWFTTQGLSYTYNGTIMSPASNSGSKFELQEYVSLGLRPIQDNACNFTETNTLGEYLRQLGN